MKVGLKDVAAEAGVSLAAASYALRPGPRPPFVSEETRAKIRAVAEDMGFRVNASARSLRSSRRYSIAIVCGQLRDRAAITAAESIIAYLNDTPYAGVVATIARVKDIRGYVLRHLDSRSHDAVIVIRDDQLITAALLKSLSRAGIKIAAIMPKGDDLPFMPLASLDRPAGASKMVEVLAEHGHRKIDFVLPSSGTLALKASLEEIAAKLHVQLQLIPLKIEQNDVNEFKVGVEIARTNLFESSATAIAVFYENLALGVVQGLSIAGVPVPGEKSVLAYGSSSVFEAYEPPISGVCHPIEEIGRSIAENVISWIEADYARQAVRQSLFTPSYVPRFTIDYGPSKQVAGGGKRNSPAKGVP